MLRLVTALALAAVLCMSGCAGSRYLTGTTAGGEKVYLGSGPQIEDEAFQRYLQSGQDERALIRYLLDRLREEKDVLYRREGEQHPWTNAYRGVSWLIRRYYHPGEDLGEFIKRYSFDPTAYIQYPNGDLHIAYYVILNELDWLKQTARRFNGASRSFAGIARG